MSYHIEKDIIPGLPNIPLSATKIVVAHESGNPNNTGKNALKNDINFMKRNWRNAFVSHWVGGGGRIVQIAPTGRMQYGAGSKANKIAYAQVELARTDDPEQFKKDYAAYVWLLRHLAQEAGLPLTLDSSSDKGIKTHKWVRNNLGGTTHVDPYGYLAKFGVSAKQFKKDIEGGTATVKPSNPKNNTNTGTGDKVTVKDSAKTYATGEPIPDWVKGNKYTVMQKKSDRVLLKEIYSWVRKSDIVEYDSAPSKPVSKPSIGNKVVLKNSADKYATGENIPSYVKGKTYTVMQEKSDRVLLKEIYSWVYKDDVSTVGGSKVVKSRDYRVGDKVRLSTRAKKYATGENIPDRYKGKTYTVMQVKSDRVLLRELYSWVKKSDLS